MPHTNINRLINLFFMTNRSLHKHMQEAKIIRSCSFLQFLTIKLVQEEGQARMKDLARFLSITPASVTSLVDGLVQMDLLERSTDSEDRRITRLRLTDAGRKLLDDTESRAKREMADIFARLSDRDRSSLISALEKLAGILTRETGSAREKRAS